MIGKTNGPISKTPHELDYFDNQFRQRKKCKVMQSDSSSKTQRHGIAQNEISSEDKANQGLSLKSEMNAKAPESISRRACKCQQKVKEEFSIKRD